MADNFNQFISGIIDERSLPEFVKDNYPTFEAFLKAYYEYLEQSKQTHDVAIHLRDYRDIDRTLEEFVDHFRNEYLINIPSHVLADKRLLAKQIKNFYVNKGNEDSYRFLFRILYGESIDFYYPKKDILRASDGKWYEQTTIKILVTPDIDLNLFNNREITGTISDASAVVESILTYIDRGVDVAELILSQIRGTFVVNEQIVLKYLDEDGVEQVITQDIQEVYTGVEITAPGSSYAIGDRIPIKDSLGNEIGSANVSRVTRGPITGISIVNGGIGYSGIEQTVSVFGALTYDYTWEGIYLADAPYQALTSNDVDFASMTYDETIDGATIPYGEGDYIEIVDSPNSSGAGAYGVVTLIDDFGTILDVELLAQGNLYENPSANVISETGSGAVIDVTGGGGAIGGMTLETFPAALASDFESNGPQAWLDFSVKGDGNADGYLTASGMSFYPGRWLNEDGQLSSSKYLQDNRYYQDYSYVIKTGVALSEWKDTIKKILHPAGLEVFGEVSISSFASSRLKVAVHKLERRIFIPKRTATATVAFSDVEIIT